MIKYTLLSLLVLLSFVTSAQEEKTTEKGNFLKWMDSKDWKLNAAGGFAVGLLTEKTYSTQWHGYLGFLQQRVEMRGDIFYFLSQFCKRFQPFFLDRNLF